MKTLPTTPCLIRLLMFLVVLAGHAGTAGAAEPTVEVAGNTISWPVDGRYEVQITLTGEIVCADDQPCTVPEGNYRVTRFSESDTSSTDVVVGDPEELAIDQSNFAYGLKVSGLTINWFIDGWYQVQDAQTYEEICNGTDSCTVPTVGRYIVINHSLGLRFELEVTNSSGPITLGGSTITWPADGWYQVKRITGEFICEGVDACSPGEGSYTVSRFYLDGGSTWPVVLGDQAGQTIPSEATVADNIISLPDDGSYEVQLTLTGEVVCESGQACTVPDGHYRITGISDGESSTQDVVVGNPVEPTIDQSNFAYGLKVSGLTINWFVDGWYQVQDAQTYEEICNGTDSCTVPTVGRYIVINHSLGLRTELEVTDTSGPIVANNTISWPRDGWYQVKNEITGSILCEGVDACSLPDGNYLVSRLYFDGGTTWRVELGSQEELPSGPTVVNNTISWPADGWYQVENRITGEIVCQGGQECTVPDGIYWVLRFHDGGNSGWRVVAGTPAELTLDQSSFAETLSVSDHTITWSVNGWYQVQDAQTFEEICNGAAFCTVPGDGQYIIINHSLGLRIQLEISDGS